MQNGKKIKELCSEFKVLLVDDEEAAREQIYNILILLFPIVFSAKDGLEAFDIYEKEKPDLVITDLTMPRLDGFGLIDLIRGVSPKQKIIVMSAHTEADVIVKSIKKGVDGYILKPIEAIQMFESIEKIALALKMEKDSELYHKQLEFKVDKQAKQLIKQLEYDTLTGLPNKAKLQLDFKENNYSQLILLNIDNFSHVNAVYGYKDGDILLQEITKYLKSILKDDIYRGDGDEFFIVLKSSNSQDALELAKMIKEKVYTKEFALTSCSIRITFSMGIVSIDSKTDEIPYSKAQLAISDMRILHKNVIGQYKDDSITKKNQMQIHEWANKAKLALDYDTLCPYYQPIVKVATGKIEKYECLARIIENSNPISPFYFIEPARIAGMVTDITRRIIEKAFETFSNSDMEFSINITDDDFKEEYLASFLQESCKKFHIKPKQVVLEILENISEYDANHAIAQMDELKSLGFQLAIDDFGAESSNFGRVQKLQVDYIKIDGSFIKDIAQNYNSLIVVKTIIYYAKHTNIKTIAEYVHDEETYEIVKDLGVDYIQGYHFSEPLRKIK